MNKTTSYICTHWAHFLSWDNHGVISLEAFHKYADVLNDFGTPTSSVSLFINCTIHQPCLPGIFQELVYTGYKKHHGMKFQRSHLPEQPSGPSLWALLHTQNNLSVLTESNLQVTLEQQAIQLGSDEGDPLEI